MHRMLAALAATLVLSALAACGGEDDAGDADTRSTESSAADNGSESPTSTEPAEPEYQQLTKKQLQGSLLTIEAMPPGYSADPPDDGSSVAKYCGSAPKKAPTKAGQDFTKGGGFTVEIASVGLAQYESEEVAAQNLERLRKGLATCKGETIEGDKVTYAVMSTPKLEHPTLGIRIEGDGYTVLLDIAQVGPTVVTAGTGGGVKADADLAADLFEQQLEAYQDVALK